MNSFEIIRTDSEIGLGMCSKWYGNYSAKGTCGCLKLDQSITVHITVHSDSTHPLVSPLFQWIQWVHMEHTSGQKKKKAGTEHFQLSKDNKLKHVCWARVVAAKASMDAKVAVHKQLRAVFKMLASEIMVSGIRSNGKWLVGLETFSKPGFLPSQKRFWRKFYSFSIVWGYWGRTGVCSEEDLKGSSRMLAYISHFQNPELEEQDLFVFKPLKCRT